MAQQDRVLVYSYDFEPGEDFNVAARLETSTTVNLLMTPDEETVPEISRPDEYTGYVIRWQRPVVQPPALMFTRGDPLTTGDTETLGEDMTVFSHQLNLVETEID